jgi:TRAP-type C4-dicarboxylate transport system permease small subunit
MKKAILNRIWNALNKVISVLGSLAILVMFSSTVIQVFFRFVLNNPLPWPEEIARYCFVWMTFIGLVMNVKSNDHYRIDFISNLLNSTTQIILDVIFNLMAVAFLLITLFGSKNLIVGNWHVLSANKISMDVVYLSLPLMSLIIIPQLIINTIKNIKIVKVSFGKRK